MKKYYISITKDNKQECIASTSVRDIPRGRKYQIIEAMNIKEAIYRACAPASSNQYPYFSA